MTDQRAGLIEMDKCPGDACDHRVCIEQQWLRSEVERLSARVRYLDERLEAEREGLRLLADEGLRPW